jgi:Flp pilus assembly protein TadG
MMRLLRRLRRDTRGAVVIETAIVAPVLALMGVGAFQVSQIVARQHEMQTGAADAASMALAGWSDDDAQVAALKGVIQRTIDLDADEVTVTRKYRCGTTDAYVDDKATCLEGEVVASYLRIELADTYTPLWTEFGVGEAVDFEVERTVLIS